MCNLPRHHWIITDQWLALYLDVINHVALYCKTCHLSGRLVYLGTTTRASWICPDHGSHGIDEGDGAAQSADEAVTKRHLTSLELI